jgi:integrase/recombinase XerD
MKEKTSKYRQRFDEEFQRDAVRMQQSSTSPKELRMTLLRQRMIEDMQVRNLSPRTQATYVLQVSLFARHFNQSPELLGPEEIRSYQVYLTNEKKLSPGSILIAVAALRFLYKVTLHKDWGLAEVIPAPKKPEKLPVILSPEEVLQFLRCVQSPEISLAGSRAAH